MDIEGMAKTAGLRDILGSLKDGDDVWIDYDVLGCLAMFATAVREKTLEDVLLEMTEQDRNKLKCLIENVRMMRSNNELTGGALAPSSDRRERG